MIVRLENVSFVIVPRRYDDPDVLELVAEVQAEYVTIYGSPDEAAVDPGEFVPPTGLLLLGRQDDEPVVTGGWRRHRGRDANGADVSVAEIKRMYVRPAARRRGLAARMLSELERTARAAGIERLVLNTGRPQRAAIELYRQAGYGPSVPFGHYADAPDAVFLEKELDLSPDASETVTH